MDGRYADEEADTPKDAWSSVRKHEWSSMGTADVVLPPSSLRVFAPSPPPGRRKGSLLRYDAPDGQPDGQTVPPLPTDDDDKMVNEALKAAAAFDQLSLSLDKGLDPGLGVGRGCKHRPAAPRASGVAPRRALPTDMRPINEPAGCEPWATSSPREKASNGSGGAASLVAASPAANDAVNLLAAAPAPAASGLLPKLVRPTRTRSMPMLHSTQREFKPPPVSVMVIGAGGPDSPSIRGWTVGDAAGEFEA